MDDLFGDLFEDQAPAPSPPNPPPAAAPKPPDRPKPTPTYQQHLCVEPGCNRWGCFGQMNTTIEASTWWCPEHIPAWFFKHLVAVQRPGKVSL